MAKIFKPAGPSVGNDKEQLELPYIAGVNALWKTV